VSRRNRREEDQEGRLTSEFVSRDSSKGSVSQVRRPRGAEEGRLQDPGGEDNLFRDAKASSVPERVERERGQTKFHSSRCQGVKSRH